MIVVVNHSEHKRMMRKLLVPMTPGDYVGMVIGLSLLLTPWALAALVIWLLAS